MKIVVSSGNSRETVAIPAQRGVRRELARRLKSFLFPSNGAYHRAKRRGERALAGAM